MVTFDRRYCPMRKGYSRESVKRDTEVVLEQEFSGRGLRDGIDGDRDFARLVSRPSENRVAVQDPIDIEAGLDDVAESAPVRGGRIRRWLRALFG